MFSSGGSSQFSAEHLKGIVAVPLNPPSTEREPAEGYGVGCAGLLVLFVACIVGPPFALILG